MKKDRFYAVSSILLALGFWIPLFNIGLSISSIILALKHLRLAHEDPKRYDGGRGKTISIIALVIGFATLAGSLIFLTVYMYRRLTCDVVRLI